MKKADKKKDKKHKKEEKVKRERQADEPACGEAEGLEEARRRAPAGRGCGAR